MLHSLLWKSSPDLCVGTLRAGMGGDADGKDNVVGNASATRSGSSRRHLIHHLGEPRREKPDPGRRPRRPSVSSPISRPPKRENSFLAEKEWEISLPLSMRARSRQTLSVDHYQYCTAIPIGTELGSDLGIRRTHGGDRVHGRKRNPGVPCGSLAGAGSEHSPESALRKKLHIIPRIRWLPENAPLP